MMNHRPMSTRRQVQLMVILTLLAWATQTLYKQWGFGGLIVSQQMQPPTRRGTVIELRSEVRPEPGATLRLRDICRWSSADADQVDGYADVILATLSEAAGVRQVTVADLRAALHDAGVNLSSIEFAGAATCRIVIGDIQLMPPRDPAMAGKTDAESDGFAGQSAAEPPRPMLADAPQTPLRDLLVGPLLQELALAEDQVQIDFDPDDAALLALTSPRCEFLIDSTRAADLGDLVWDVTIRDEAGERRVAVGAAIRTWEEQLVPTRSLSRGQRIAATDVDVRRALVTVRQAAPVSDVAEAIGQLAARDLKPGEAMTLDDLVPPNLIGKGDFINVSVKIGEASVSTVARAMEAGRKGAVIQARNEATRDVYRVVVTGVSAGDVIAE